MNDHHVMLDLETADCAPTSAIVSIGALVFVGPQQGTCFYCAIDLGSSIAAGLTVSEHTMRWWDKQSPEARSVFNDPKRMSLSDALTGFAEFIPADAKLWGNGAAFDNAVLANAYFRTGLPLPWKFWNDRCYRTIAALIPGKRQQKGTHHNALDDAVSQAQHLLRDGPEFIA